MDQELLEIIMDSLNRFKDVSIIDRAFLQVGYIRKRGYDILPVSELKALRDQQLILQSENQNLANANNHLTEMETQYRLLFEKQQLHIATLEQEIRQLKNSRL